MTITNTRPMSSGKFFSYFQLYWNYCSQREITVSNLDVFIKTSFIYVFLRKEWEKNNWLIDELEWICQQIYFQNTMFDPVIFENEEYAYLNHVENCFYMGDSFLD